MTSFTGWRAFVRALRGAPHELLDSSILCNLSGSLTAVLVWRWRTGHAAYGWLALSIIAAMLAVLGRLPDLPTDLRPSRRITARLAFFVCGVALANIIGLLMRTVLVEGGSAAAFDSAGSAHCRQAALYCGASAVAIERTRMLKASSLERPVIALLWVSVAVWWGMSTR